MVDTRSFWGDAPSAPATDKEREPRRLPKLRPPSLTPRKRRAAIGIMTLTLLVALAVTAGAAPGAIERPLGYNAIPNPPVSNPETLTLPFPMTYGFTPYGPGTPLYMHDEGVVGIGAPAPPPFAMGTFPFAAPGPDMIAPFWSTMTWSPGLSYGTTFTVGNGMPGVHMNWEGASHAITGDPQVFQLILVDRSDVVPGDFDMILNYDILPFGLAGIPGLDVPIEQAGWTSFTMPGYEFPGSAFGAPPGTGAGEMHDGQPFSLSAGSTNGTPGKYYFTSRAGIITTDQVPPTDPSVLSILTGQTLGVWSGSAFVDIGWSGDASDGPGSGIDGYSVSFSQNTTEVPPAIKTHEEFNFSHGENLADGVWWFNLRTVDAAGNWTNTEHLGPFLIDDNVPIDPVLASTLPTDTIVLTDTIHVTWSGAFDAGSGVSGYSFSFTPDDSATPDMIPDAAADEESATFMTYAGGTYWFNLRTVDNMGYWTNTVHIGPFLLSMDATPPVDPTGMSSPTHNLGQWHTNPSIVVTWSDDATDTDSSVDGFSFSWSQDDTALPDTVKDMEESVLQTSAVLPDGWWWANLRTVDAAGNWTSTMHLGPFGIDTTPPVTTDDAVPLYFDSATISLTATDNGGSGVDYTAWRLDGTALATSGVNPTIVTTDTIGFHTLEYFSVDNTGNVEATKSVGFEIVEDPTAIDDFYMVDEDDILAVPAPGVTMNDLSSSPLLISFPTTQTANGTVVAAGVFGGFFYVPDPDFNGIDTFEYLATDLSDADTATVTIMVNPVPDDPVIDNGASEEVTTTEDTTVAVGLSASHPDTDTLSWGIAVPPLDGVAVASGVGTSTVVTYTPDPDFNGDDAFTVRVEDPWGNTDLIVVTVHVLPVNDPPVAVDDAYFTPEDTVLIVPAPGFLGNDTDVEGDPLTLDFGSLTLIDPGPLDMLLLAGDGSFTASATPDATGTVVLTYAASDGVATSTAPATWTITFTDVNDPPTDIALSSNVVTENLPPATVVGTLTATDIDSNPPFTYSLEGTAASKFQIAGDQLQTAMTLDFEMQTSYDLTITVDDGDGGTYSEPFTVDVLNENEAPVAVNDTYTIAEDTTLTVLPPYTAPPWQNSGPTLLANDYDPDGDPFLWQFGYWDTTSTVGLVTPFGPPGDFGYIPPPDWFGTTTFTYWMQEDTGAGPGPGSLISNVATVTLIVTPVNDPPVALDDSATVQEDGVLFMSTSVLDNDSDPVEGDPLTAWLDTPPSNGSVIFNSPSGTYVYTPDPDYNGPDSFTYWCSDGSDAVTATVDITVTPVNDPPVIAQGSTLATTTPEDIDKFVSLDATDTESDPMWWYIATPPANGTASLDTSMSDSVVASYSPDADWNGTDSFEVVVVDGNGGSDSILVTIFVTPVNDPPVAYPNTYYTPEDTTLTVAAPGHLANDVDVDGDPISWWNYGPGPFNGTMVNPLVTGAFQYVPDPDWNGTDTVQVTVADPSFALSNTTTLTIVVTPVNDAPHDIFLSSTEITENLPPNSVVCTLGASDIDSTDFTFSIEPTTAPFRIAADGITMKATESFNFEAIPSYDLTITVTDDWGASYVETFTIDVLDDNDQPVSMDDWYGTFEDTPLVVAPPGLFANDSDEDSDTLSIVLGAGPYNGSLEASLTSGGITYTPDPNWFGTDTFEYAVWDGMLLSATSTVSIEVTSVNDVPTAAGNTYSTPEDTTLVIGAPGILGNDSDVEGPLMAALDTDVTFGTLTLNADGSLTYVPADGWSGTDSFTYHATDGEDDSPIRTVTIKVKSVDTVGISVWGSDRMGTAIAASKKMYPGGSEYVVICTAYNWPDALGGSALAGVVDAPILVTPTGELRPEVRAEITRLGASKAIVLGGPAAISPGTFGAIRAAVGGPTKRIGGADRYATAKMVAAEVISKLGVAFDGTAFAATGVDYPDALSASPMAAANGWPIYLIRPTGSNTDVRNEAKADGVTDIVVLGGKSNVSNANQTMLGATGIGTTRISGGERHSTAVAIAEYGVNNGGLGWDGVVIARSDEFPDALTGGVYAAGQGTVLLMTPSTYLHEATADALLAKRAMIDKYSIMGGTAAISTGVRDDIRSILR